MRCGGRREPAPRPRRRRDRRRRGGTDWDRRDRGPRSAPHPRIEPPPALPAAPRGVDERPAAGRAATRAAVSYALAARNWSARTVRSAWRRQYALAAGRLRRELARTRPTRSRLAALEGERGSQLALVTGSPQPRITGRHANVVVELAERTATAGRAVTYRSCNRTRLRRIAAGWRVTGWTRLPDPGTAP